MWKGQKDEVARHTYMVQALVLMRESQPLQTQATRHPLALSCLQFVFAHPGSFSSYHFYFLAKDRGRVKLCVATCMNDQQVSEDKDWASTLSNMLEMTCHLFGCVTEDSWLSYPKLVVSPKDTPVSGFKNGGTEIERSPALRFDRLPFVLPAGELCPNE
jgi:hypothetical protein